MSTGSEAFFPLMCRDVAKFVRHLYFSVALLLLSKSILSCIKTIFLKIWGKTTAQECKTFISGLRSSLKNVFAELPIAFTTRFSYALIWYEPLQLRLWEMISGARGQFKKSGFQAVNTSNSGSGGPGFRPRQSRCFFRQGTLLHFKWVPARSQGSWYRRHSAGGNSAMD